MSGPEGRRAPRRTVGAFGGDLGERLRRALELAHPVLLERRDEGEWRGLDGVLDLGDGAVAHAAAAAALPALHLAGREDRTPPARRLGELRLAPGDTVDRRLRRAALLDPRAESSEAPPPPGSAEFLAGREGGVLWWRQGPLRGAALLPAELGEDEALRDRLSPARSLALLPLEAFLRDVCADLAWTPPPPRAAFLFDDPNLHWPTYGYVDLPALSRHAREHEYHVALATVPLDARWAHRGALAALSDAAGAISLTVHGNDHDGGELGRPASLEEATALAAQALRRVAAFERRTGRPVDRVMVPPHEACSATTVTALRRCGFEAISATLPYPWLGSPGAGWLAHPGDADSLVGWRPVGRTVGLPSILRHPLTGRSGAELRLRAYLDQPLVLYGHHDDLADGLDVLAAAHAEVDAIAPGTGWSSLARIARGSYETRLDGSRLSVRPLADRLEVTVPDGVDVFRIEPPADPSAAAARLTVDAVPRSYGEEIAVAAGTSEVTVVLGEAPLEPCSVRPPRPRPLAVVRRLASESRDRLLPVLAR